MAVDTNNGDRDISADTAATPASTSSLYVVDEGMNDAEHEALQRPPPQSDAYYRDLYKDRLDFRALARDDPDLKAVLNHHHGQLDFRDPEAVRQLTKTLLRRDFGLVVELPPDRLCPPVPNRLSYVVWIKALLESTTLDSADDYVVGLDIGTGASCIYPLLTCVQRPAWRFLASDVDAASLESARANVARNGLTERIRVVARSPEDPLVFLGDSSSLTFTMCNPPFYASADEMAASAAAKQCPPHSACTGAPVEMVYSPKGGDESAGGEVAFVGRILAESAVLRDRVRWYTAMLGKLASLGELVAQLRARGIDNYAVAAFVHGTKTRRWALGWSWGARRPTVAVARGGGDNSGLESYRRVLPHITEVDVFSVPRAAPVYRGGGDKTVSTTSATGLSTTIEALMRSLALASWVWDDKKMQGVGRARENIWGRAWRRKKQREEKEAVEGGTTKKKVNDAVTAALGPDEECAFGFVVTVRVGITETIVNCRWLEGHNEAIYQSFCGFLKTNLKDSTTSLATNC